MNEQQLLLKDMLDRLFGELAESRGEELGTKDGFAHRWAQFEAMGLQDLLVPEDEGGFGGGGGEAWLLAHAAGRNAVDLPVIEAVVAARLLSIAKLAAPAGVLSIAARVVGELDEAATFTGTLRGVPWGRYADHAVALIDTDAGRRLICVETARADVVHHANAADEPRDDLRFERTPIMCALYAGPDILRLGALARAAQTAGACRGAMELGIAHVTARSQFGKPLAKFQAVQHSLATLAEQVSAAEAASRAAYGSGEGLLETASAKIVANLASEAAVAIAHQMHGAIGFTWDYALHHLTRRLIAWRGEFGTTRYWSSALGTLAAAQGADDYWAFLVDGSEGRAAADVA